MAEHQTRREFLQRGSALAVATVVGGVAISDLLAACGGSAAGAETTWQRILRTKTIRVGWSNESPFSVADANGDLSGQDPSVLKAALSAYDIKNYDGVLIEFGALIPALVANRIDVITEGMFIRPKRCAQITFANPDSINRDTFLVKSGNPLNLRSYADVAKNPKARITATRGTAEADRITQAGIPQSQQLILPDAQGSVAAVQSGRADAFAAPLVYLASIVKTANDASIQLVTDFVDPLGPNGKPAIDYAGAGFRKEDTDLIAAYNKGLADLVANGQLKQINEKWGIPASATPDGSAPTATAICAG